MRWPDWQVLCGRFGLGAPTAEPVPAAAGAMGEIWRLSTTAGRWAVKVLHPWAPTDPYPADLEVQMAALAAGLPLPQPIKTRDGAVVVTVGSVSVRIYEWVDLAAPLETPVTIEVAGKLGELLGRIHDLGLPVTDSVDPWYTTVPTRALWNDLCDRAASAGASWAPTLSASRPTIDALTSRVSASPGHDLVVGHRDFEPTNVLPASDDSTLMILDWENAGPISAMQELGATMLAFASGPDGASIEAAAALLAGYRTVAPDNGRRLPRDLFTTAVATRLNFLYIQGLQTLDDDTFAQLAARNVDLALTDTRLDRLLAAVENLNAFARSIE